MNRFFLAIVILGCVCGRAAAADGVEADLRKASAAYADAYNKRDYQALAAQWTERAELVEGGARVVGRDAIVASIRRWLEIHPQAALAVTVDAVEPVAGPLARVRGTLAFTKKPGAKPVVTPFESLRVLEDGAWRLAESIVAPSHAAALDDLDWLVGIWRATDTQAGTTVTATFDKALGGHLIAGGMKIVPKSGATLESFEVIHADRETGQVRSWLFDSTGARAEGVFSADGTGFSRTFVGTPAAGSGAGRAVWTQVIVPGGEGRFTLQSIERSLDGQPLPDNPPLHFRRQ
ncbi:MAG: nuclear transport factor 2 family protein [Planctomycetia bacterium]